MKDAGIDYGMGQSNRDHKTGIHYGVIHSGHVGQAWYDESEDVYVYHCPHCGNGPLKRGVDAKRCPDCRKSIDPDRDWDDLEPAAWTYDQHGYRAEQGGDDCDIYVTLSPYYTLCSYCSPCAPGAGYLEGQNENGIKAYCLGHDWFEDGRAPYRVFDVKTGKEVLP